MDLIFPSGLRISLPEEAKEECEFIKTVLELEDVNEISINLPFELTNTYLKKYELSYDELSELTEEELERWLQLKAFLGYYENGEKYDNEIKELRKVINDYKEKGVWPEGYNNIKFLAARKGYQKVLKYAHEKGCSWSKNTCGEAAKTGHLDCLKYARENGCSWDIYTCWDAAGYGHLDCLKYAHEKGCYWDERICSCASLNGNLNCLKYALENGCPWNERTCSCAAANGHLECLIWARENGCPWNSNVYFRAYENYHFSCAQWAKDNGCPTE